MDPTKTGKFGEAKFTAKACTIDLIQIQRVCSNVIFAKNMNQIKSAWKRGK